VFEEMAAASALRRCGLSAARPAGDHTQLVSNTSRVRRAPARGHPGL